MYVCMYVCMHVCICMYVCMYVCMCIYIYIHMCVHMYIYIYNISLSLSLSRFNAGANTVDTKQRISTATSANRKSWERIVIIKYYYYYDYYSLLLLLSLLSWELIVRSSRPAPPPICSQGEKMLFVMLYYVIPIYMYIYIVCLYAMCCFSHNQTYFDYCLDPRLVSSAYVLLFVHKARRHI